MKKTIKLFTLALTLTLALGLVACGKDKEKEYEDAPLGSIDLDATINENTNKEEESKEESNNKNDDVSEEINISAMKEEDIVVYIAGKEVKLDQTWEEFQKMVEDYGWSYTDDYGNDWPHYDEEEKELYNMGSGYIQTPIGKVEFSFMDNEEESGSVLREIRFVFNYIVKNDFSVCGINMTTTFDEINGKLELLSESENGCKYKVDDCVTIYVGTPYKGKSDVSIEREQFHMRNK